MLRMALLLRVTGMAIVPEGKGVVKGLLD